MLDSVFAGPAYRWAERPRLLDRLARLWAELLEWLRRLESSNPLLFKLVLGALALVLAVILLHAAWVLLRTLRLAGRTEADSTPVARARLHDASWHFARADRLAGAGQYAEAMRAAFGGVVMRLDESGSLPFDPSRTPAECARAARVASTDRERLRDLVRRLYPVVFGGAPCSRDEYERWRAAAGAEWHALAN